jgi:HlyD family secretion protein
MSTRSLVAAACVLALTLAACNKADPTYQGWIEANLIFVAPDEVGRVQML